jgi:hypothetical protein
LPLEEILVESKWTGLAWVSMEMFHRSMKEKRSSLDVCAKACKRFLEEDSEAVARKREMI